MKVKNSKTIFSFLRVSTGNTGVTLRVTFKNNILLALLEWH